MKISKNGSGAAHVGLFGRPTIHMQSAGDPGGGGGGGGGDDEARWNERFHKASTEREKRFKASLMKEMGAMLESQFGAKFDELRKILVESEPGPGPGEEREGERLSTAVERILRRRS